MSESDELAAQKIIEIIELYKLDNDDIEEMMAYVDFRRRKYQNERAIYKY